MRLWKLWVEHTRRMAMGRAELDKLLYGTGFVIERWWGWQRLDPYNVHILRRI